MPRIVDETDFGFGWMPDGDMLRRTSHALAVDGRAYVVDPVDVQGLDERLRALGEPVSVIVLLDRHRRDADAVATRLGVPVHDTPFAGVDGAPFEFRRIVRNRVWREVALWWRERRVLVAADALGSVGYFVAPGESLGVHPFLRPWPPRRALGDLDPEHVLVGHGEGVHGPAASPALRTALATARTGVPRVALGLVRRRRRTRSP